MNAVLYRASGRGRRAVSAVIALACLSALDWRASESLAAEPMSADPTQIHVDSRCTTCHTFDASLSHPVGITATMRVPAGFPLLDGRITCTTCHDEAEHDLGATRGGGMLRGGLGVTTLCASCHAEGEGRSGAHGRGIGRAHLPASARRSVNAELNLDIESATCMGCHDGAVAADAGNHRMGGAGEMSGDHPIGTPLAMGRADREELVLRKPRDVDARVRLFDGNVGCGSCHSVYSKRDNLLVMNNAGSALCLSCHVQ